MLTAHPPDISNHQFLEERHLSELDLQVPALFHPESFAKMHREELEAATGL